MALSTRNNFSSKYILLTFDVEDWFQVENFKAYVPFSSWPSFELRVEKNTHRILDQLDSFSFSPKATFFVMGWIAHKIPQLVNEIQLRGHEVASHGFNHHLCTKLKPEELCQDLDYSRKLLEDLTNSKIVGYRAPSFAVNNEILRYIQAAGYQYDSSFNSFGLHGRYGSVKLGESLGDSQCFRLPQFMNQDNAGGESLGPLYELPISNLHCASKVFPLGGGGYFRLIPFPIFRQGMKRIFRKQDAFVFYSHPWEFDPGQPKVSQASRGFKFRHYTNLKRTRSKMSALLDSFSNIRFVTCNEYLNISRNAVK